MGKGFVVNRRDRGYPGPKRLNPKQGFGVFFFFFGGGGVGLTFIVYYLADEMGEHDADTVLRELERLDDWLDTYADAATDSSPFEIELQQMREQVRVFRLTHIRIMHMYILQCLIHELQG